MKNADQFIKRTIMPFLVVVLGGLSIYYFFTSKSAFDGTFKNTYSVLLVLVFCFLILLFSGRKKKQNTENIVSNPPLKNETDIPTTMPEELNEEGLKSKCSTLNEEEEFYFIPSSDLKIGDWMSREFLEDRVNREVMWEKKLEVVIIFPKNEKGYYLLRSHKKPSYH